MDDAKEYISKCGYNQDSAISFDAAITLLAGYAAYKATPTVSFPCPKFPSGSPLPKESKCEDVKGPSPMSYLLDLCNTNFPGFEAAIFFTVKNGQTFMNPIFKTEGMTIPKMLEDVTRYAQACEYFVKDISTKVALKDRKN